jgi:hypothetical protein
LLERARRMLAGVGQAELGFDVEAAPRKARLLPAPVTGGVLFADAARPAGGPESRVGAARVVGTASGLLFDALAGIYDALGFDAVGDAVFRDLVISRIVEPTSLLDTGRVLTDLGRTAVNERTMRRALDRALTRGYRDQIATACFNHVLTNGDVSLVLYDVTTLYFEAEKEDELRKVGYSKERRVDPQVVVGLLVDRHGFPLEIGCFEGNKAETLTIVPIVKQFQDRHQLADMVVVADAGMLSATNLRELDEAGLRFIVGSRLTKAPKDLESHFRWHGTAFTDGQIIDTITPRDQRGTQVTASDPKTKAEPVWDPAVHQRSWRAVWAYSSNRAVRDNKTLTLQENKARAVVAGEKTTKTPRFVTIRNGARHLDEASLARARGLIGLKGYVTNIEATAMSAGDVIASYHDLWHVEQSFRMSKTDLRARPMFHHKRDAIEAHLTIVFTALAVSREVQARTGLTVRKVVRELRPLRSATLSINGAMQTFRAETRPEQQAILNALK